MIERIFPDGLDPVHVLGAAAVLVAAVLLGWLVRHILKRLYVKAQCDANLVLWEYLLGALATPVLLAVTLLGIYFGLRYLPLAPSVDQEVLRWLLVALVATGIFAVLSIVDGFLKWYTCEVAAQTKTTLDDKIFPILRFSSQIVGGLLGVLLILRMLGIQHEGVNAWLAGSGTRILIIVALALAAFFGVSRAVPVAVKKTVGRGLAGHPPEEAVKRSDTLANVLVATGQVLILIAGALMLLNELLPGKITPLLAGVGVVGLAVGFGAQSLVKDVINGLFIIMEGQYSVGDVARVADIGGLVTDINLRRTVLRDLDGIVHYIPNSEIRIASNFTQEFSRVNLNVSVAYDVDLNRAIASINAVGKALSEDPEWKDHIITPPQVLRVDNLGDSGIDLKITGDTKPLKQWDITGQLRKRIKEAFDREGIEIPWPHTKVYFGDSGLNIRVQPKDIDRSDSSAPR